MVMEFVYRDMYGVLILHTKVPSSKKLTTKLINSLTPICCIPPKNTLANPRINNNR